MRPIAEPVPTGEQRDTGDRKRAAGPGYLIIVARDRPELLSHLRAALVDWPDAEVLADRRYGGRSPWNTPRRVERRCPLSRETDVRARAFLLVQRQA